MEKTVITNSDRLELTSELAHQKLLAEWESDERKDPIYLEVNGETTYTEVAQDIFNEHLEYYENELLKVFEVKDEEPNMNSWIEQLNTRWREYKIEEPLDDDDRDQ